MARAPERLRVRALGPDEHIGVTRHVPRDQHRLADVAVGRRHVRMAGREGSRGSLPMYTKTALTSLDPVGLPLRVVVGDVVDEPKSEILPRASEDPAERLAHAVRHHLPIGEGEVAGGVHRAEVALRLGGGERRARQLPIRKVDAVRSRRGQHHVQIVGAHLMSQAA